MYQSVNRSTIQWFFFCLPIRLLLCCYEWCCSLVVSIVSNAHRTHTSTQNRSGKGNRFYLLVICELWAYVFSHLNRLYPFYAWYTYSSSLPLGLVRIFKHRTNKKFAVFVEVLCVCIRFIRVSFNPPSLLRSTHCSLFDIHFRSLHSGSMVHFELLTIFGHFTNTVWNTTIEQDNTIIDNDLVESQNVDNESMTTRIMPIRTTGPLLDEKRSVCEWSVRTNTWWL